MRILSAWQTVVFAITLVRSSLFSDDDDYLPPNKRPKNTESTNEAANTGRRKVREFNFGKIQNEGSSFARLLLSEKFVLCSGTA